MEIKKRNIRLDLQESIDTIEEEYQLYQQKVNYYKMYEAITEMFKPTDIDVLITSTRNMPMLYVGMVSKEMAEKKSQEMLECLYFIKNVNDKDYQDYYDTQRAIKRFNAMVLEFEKEKNRYYEEVKKERMSIHAKKDLQRKYCLLKSKLDHQGVLGEEDISFLANYMIQRGFTREQQILSLEYIRAHNMKIEHPDYTISTQVRDMIHSKYYEMPISSLQKLQYTKYQSDIFAYQKALENSSNISEEIEMISEAENCYEKKDCYFFIIKSLVNIYAQRLNADIEDLKKYYEDDELRKVVLATYREHRKKHSLLRSLYYKKQEQEKTQDKSKEVVNELYYPGKDTSYLERDLKDIPEEKLLELKELIEKKKTGALSQKEDSSLRHNEKLAGLRELRGDQIRICYRHLEKNRFAIVGAFIKKDDNLIHAYENMAERKVDMDLSSEEKMIQELLKSQTTEQRIFDYIEQNYRIGSR